MPLRIKDISLYTVRDVARQLGIAEGTVRKYLREGRLAGRKHAGAWHVTEESFRAFLQHSDDDLPAEGVPQRGIREGEEAPDLEGELSPLSPDAAKPTGPSNESPPAATDSLPLRSPADVDELELLIQEAKRLKAEARRLERLYVDPSLEDIPPDR